MFNKMKDAAAKATFAVSIAMNPGVTPTAFTVTAAVAGLLTACGGGGDHVEAAPADTTAPSQTSSTDLGVFTLGDSLTKTLSFDEPIASAIVSGLPVGVTATTLISGSSVTVTLNVDPTKFLFTKPTQVIPFTLTVTDLVQNPRDIVQSASLDDVAPNFAAQADVTRGDFGGGGPIVPVTNICPTAPDQFGRNIVCVATVNFVSGGVVSGGLSYNVGTDSVEGTIDVFTTTVFQIQRTTQSNNSTIPITTNSSLTINDD